MTIINFAKNLKKLNKPGRPPRRATREQREIVDDTVAMGHESTEWTKEERNGRIYLTRR